MTTNVKPGGDADKLKINEKKWSKPLMAAGWTAIPSIIIEKQAALGLDAIDMNIIVHLSTYWWQADNLPHPSVETIAKALGLTPRAIQKRIKGLESVGLMKREERRFTKDGSVPNLYSFQGLIDAARPFAEEKRAAMDKAAAEKQARVSRKKPRLVVDNEGK